MKNVLIFTAVFILTLLALKVFAGASGSYGAQGIGPIAPTLANCPAPMKKFALVCPVGSAGTFSMYVSYDGNPYELKF